MHVYMSFLADITGLTRRLNDSPWRLEASLIWSHPRVAVGKCLSSSRCDGGWERRLLFCRFSRGATFPHISAYFREFSHISACFGNFDTFPHISAHLVSPFSCIVITQPNVMRHIVSSQGCWEAYTVYSIHPILSIGAWASEGPGSRGQRLERKGP